MGVRAVTSQRARARAGMSPAPGSKASGGAACPVGGGRLPTGHSEDHLGTLCRAGQMRYRPRDLQKHQQDQCEGRGLQR